MKTQQIIIGEAYTEFTARVNNLLEKGWIVVPGSFQMTGVSIALKETLPLCDGRGYQFRYGVVLEKSEN